MQKPAITSCEIHPVLKQRWSPRSFNPDKPVPRQQLLRLFEAARWAPSAFNEQPWRYILGIKGHENWQKIFDSLVEFNRDWAVHAPVLLVTLAKKTFTKNGKDNAHRLYDLGDSVAHMSFQAYADGLVMHQMGGFSAAKLTEAFAISEAFEPVTVIAVGYQDLPAKLQGSLYDSEIAGRTRKPVEELVISGL